MGNSSMKNSSNATHSLPKIDKHCFLPESISKTTCRQDRKTKCYKAGKITRNPFLNFLRIYRVQNGNKSVIQLTKAAGAVWRKMDQKQKEPYIKAARRKTTLVEGFRSADNVGHETADEASDGEVEGESAVQQAWGELADIEREQERWSELRGNIEQKLEDCRQRGVTLEDQLPDVLSSDDEREILALMCRVHELEADKMALQSERLVRQHELRRRDLVILRYDRQRQLCEEIITRQRQLIEENKLKLPPDLQELYQIYQQEIHAATYADYSVSPIISPDKLPPISKIYSDPIFRRGASTADLTVSEGTPPSSAESDASPLPRASSHSNVDQIMGHIVSRPGLSMKLPPLQPPSPPGRSKRGNNSQNIRRTASEDSITSRQE